MKRPPITAAWHEAPRWIPGVTALHLGVGTVAWLMWNPQGSFTWMRRYFRYEGALFLVVMALAQWALCRFVRSHFSKDEAMYSAWRMLTWSAGCQVAGLTLRHLLSEPSVINPLPADVLLGSGDLSKVIGSLGRVIAGPVAFTILAVGLWKVIAVCRRCRIPMRPGRLDIAVLVIGLLLCFHQISQIPLASELFGAHFDVFQKLLWTTDPLLAILLTEAFLLRQYMRRMAGGLLSKCWTAYCTAVLFTLGGNMGTWAVAYGFVQWPATSLTWYLWYPAAAAFALAPAYQVRAILAARKSQAAETYQLPQTA